MNENLHIRLKEFAFNQTPLLTIAPRAELRTNTPHSERGDFILPQTLFYSDLLSSTETFVYLKILE